MKTLEEKAREYRRQEGLTPNFEEDNFEAGYNVGLESGFIAGHNEANRWRDMPIEVPLVLGKDERCSVYITAGRNIEYTGDIALEIGIIGSDYFLFGYPCINGQHTHTDELFRIRIDKMRLADWAEFMCRLSIHIKEKGE